MAEPAVTRGLPGLFGKIPANGDFVGSGARDRLAQGFTRWLEEATDACHRAGTALPPSPIRFLFRAAGDASGLVGALRGSRDRVGRQFPLAVFLPAGGRFLETAWPCLPAGCRPFLDAAAGLLGEADALTAPALADRLRSLPLPGPGDLARAEEEGRDVAGRLRGRDFQLRVFGDPALGRHLYGLHAFGSACRAVRGREPARAEVVLDCPVEGEGDLWAWLELARRVLAWPGAPPFLWRDGSSGRLLLSLGPPPAAVMTSLGEPRRDGTRVWPLAGAQASAVASARRTLGEAGAAALERPDSTIAELAEVLLQ